MSTRECIRHPSIHPSIRQSIDPSRLIWLPYKTDFWLRFEENLCASRPTLNLEQWQFFPVEFINYSGLYFPFFIFIISFAYIFWLITFVCWFIFLFLFIHLSYYCDEETKGKMNYDFFSQFFFPRKAWASVKFFWLDPIINLSLSQMNDRSHRGGVSRWYAE